MTQNTEATMTYRYTSPLRPLDIGYAARLGGVGIDWEHTDIGPDWNRDKVYGFDGPLPANVVEGLELQEVRDA